MWGRSWPVGSATQPHGLPVERAQSKRTLGGVMKATRVHHHWCGAIHLEAQQVTQTRKEGVQQYQVRVLVQRKSQKNPLTPEHQQEPLMSGRTCCLCPAGFSPSREGCTLGVVVG
jgi:hypothetical protein